MLLSYSDLTRSRFAPQLGGDNTEAGQWILGLFFKRFNSSRLAAHQKVDSTQYAREECFRKAVKKDLGVGTQVSQIHRDGGVLSPNDRWIFSFWLPDLACSNE
jgi:hypothetical protein